MDKVITNKDFASRFLYRDDDFALVQKFAGELCEDFDAQNGTTQNAGAQNNSTQSLPALVANFTQNTFVQCVNRLDVPVSGCVAVAFNKKTFCALTQLFATQNAVQKYYIAIVQKPKDFSAQKYPLFVKNELLHAHFFDTKKRKAFVISITNFKSQKLPAKYKLARLYYTLVGEGANYLFVAVELFTGRTHQIRSQLAAVGLHIKGDVKYGARRSDNLAGIRLHNNFISFLHPYTQKQIQVFVPLPQVDALWTSCMDAFDNYKNVQN